MRRIGLVVVLALILYAPIAVEVQPASRVYRIGVLSSGLPLIDAAGRERSYS
jgi:hypothetical protein